VDPIADGIPPFHSLSRLKLEASQDVPVSFGIDPTLDRLPLGDEIAGTFRSIVV
jgi:hypothetical protein